MIFNNRNVFISKNAKIGKNVKVGDNTVIYDNVIIGDDTIIANNCVIGEPLNLYNHNIKNYINFETVIGNNNKIHPYTIINSSTFIENNNEIGPHCVIGCSPTDTKHIEHRGVNSFVKIGNNNIIREFSVVEQPCYEDRTIIQNNVFLMQGVHISHDVIIEDDAVITNLSVLGGIVKVLKGANVAMCCSINQYTTIGQYSIVATNSACMKNVKPFSRYIPNKPISINNYAIQKYGFTEYEKEIAKYVLGNEPCKSPVLVEIIDEFDQWVAKYGHQTY